MAEVEDSGKSKKIGNGKIMVRVFTPEGEIEYDECKKIISIGTKHVTFADKSGTVVTSNCQYVIEDGTITEESWREATDGNASSADDSSQMMEKLARVIARGGAVTAYKS